MSPRQIVQDFFLDWPAIYQRLTPFVELKEEPEILTRLRKIESEPVD